MKHRPKIDKSALRFGETVRTREPAYIAWLHTQPCVVTAASVARWWSIIRGRSYRIRGPRDGSVQTVSP